ncbi:L-asparaginase/GlutRNAGln amidotransferase subunit D [Terriglobus roseus DSM 18391]|uniref:L-asparaginase/GlutRNAGln amidotransferase subunit D n=1 Tax=Terriglobus roseus (strain DSM 18391 / NRRL B-41598 / KBS 63) TaxID=926566 RepID=I3ZL56_TERRK|nr:asparaginase domain-containing protein [Terriglobus roseus]AFL89974.1 L-asparaginase/GlutRNAGln amidotransferase subunit D [Terriglobus roseus DSM 18391]
MHRVHLITTGGTIEKRYVEQDGSMENTVPQIRRCLSMLRLPDTAITVEELMNIDSLVMTNDHRKLIAERVLAQATEGTPVLVTHGTDTVVETGKVVAETLAQHSAAATVPVVFTGAMTPFGIEGSDALQNLTEALLATRMLPGGVYLAFHGQVFPIANVRKDRENSRFLRID